MHKTVIGRIETRLVLPVTPKPPSTKLCIHIRASTYGLIPVPMISTHNTSVVESKS